MQRRLYIDEAHTALDIFRFAAFFQDVIQFFQSPSLDTQASPSQLKNIFFYTFVLFAYDLCLKLDSKRICVKFLCHRGSFDITVS